MSYCAWCKSWGRGPVVTLSEPRHVIISDGVNEPHAIAVVEISAGKKICAAHPTISQEDARRRWRRESPVKESAPHILITPTRGEA